MHSHSIQPELEQQCFYFLYKQDLEDLHLQSKCKPIIDGYSLAVSRIIKHFDRSPDNLEYRDLKQYISMPYFNLTLGVPSKLSAMACSFFYRIR
ncbi:hypothetical protein D5R81_19295 [Parashewanella spongiae]|uniref:Uncharacterized protein n=1 Tax=Parashewanella spongiae TaxID=342950 RepID=A0A3A6SUQ9_9GAMM|nr:hypothetical protein [Parashewanella spongiae]MCL1080208.1 hypothetical protein [Parashewanella spongiae]RJY02336.1 hypothetical protein D5R81_19295 [Parashewanella spongiae]